MPWTCDTDAAGSPGDPGGVRHPTHYTDDTGGQCRSDHPHPDAVQLSPMDPTVVPGQLDRTDPKR